MKVLNRIRDWWHASRIRVLHLQPGDIVCLCYDGNLTMEQADRIKRVWNERFPDTPAAVMDSGLRPEAVLHVDRSGLPDPIIPENRDAPAPRREPTTESPFDVEPRNQPRVKCRPWPEPDGKRWWQR